VDSSRFDISIVNRPVDRIRAKLDGTPIECTGKEVRIRLDGRTHDLSIESPLRCDPPHALQRP
jgi:hypothetical protein